MYKKEVKLKTEQQNQIVSNDEELQTDQIRPKTFFSVRVVIAKTGENVQLRSPWTSRPFVFWKGGKLCVFTKKITKS